MTDSSSSIFVLAASVVAATAYTYNAYYMYRYVDPRDRNSIPDTVELYGDYTGLIYLTFQTLMMHVITYQLHVWAHFFKRLEPVRDVFFTAFAFPFGCLVCLTLWCVWFSMGREYIYPHEWDGVIPVWMHHNMHTALVPVNILFACLLEHRYHKWAVLLPLAFALLYAIGLHVVKLQTDYWVYTYLDQFESHTTRMIYMLVTGFLVAVYYYLGELLTRWFHGRQITRALFSSNPAKSHKPVRRSE